jgi:two-component system, LytTR family, response regulator
MTLRCIAIDDEPIALDIIRAHAEKVPFLNLTQTYVNALEALTVVQTDPPDLIFLDINMPDLTGIDFAQLLNGRSMVVFTTAYPEFALQGFDLSALDYLLKPISFGRFLAACNKAYERQLPPPTVPGAGPARSPFVFVKDGYDWVRVNLDELQYVESDGNYLTFQETGKKLLTRMTIGEAIELLPPDKFLRIHKSFIVSLTRIEKIERHQVTIGKAQIPLSGSYKDELMARVK